MWLGLSHLEQSGQLNALKIESYMAFASTGAGLLDPSRLDVFITI